MFIRATSLLMVLMILGLPSAAFAQEGNGQEPTGTVVGQVDDGELDKPIPTATVELRSARDSSLVTGAITEEDGTFEIEDIAAGRYYVRVSFVGYGAETVPDVTLTAEQQRVDVGTVTLRTETTELDEVEVSAERNYMEVGIDRTIYNTRDQPVTMGGSAQDVLETIPSVEVDLDGNISLRGSQGVTVYLNGKPAPMSGEALTSFLEGLSAGDIERVEVIPNPSAAYEPEGMSGILNIVLAKNMELGWGGGVQVSANTRGRYNGSVNGNFGRGPWNIFSNYSLRYSEWDRNGWRFRENRYLDPLTFLEQDIEGERGGFSNNFNTSVDYSFDDKTTLSLMGILSHRQRNGDRTNSYTELNADRSPTERYTRTTDGDETELSMDYRLDFKRVITPREHELTVEARYESERQDELERYVERVLPLTDPEAVGAVDDRQNVDENEHEREASFEVDYTRPLGERVRLEAGYESDFEWVDNSFFSESLGESGAFVPDVSLNNTFRYAEQMHSLYGVLGSKLGPIGAQLGLRLERALTNFDLVTTDESFENDYTSLFPSVHLSYEVNQQNTFKASYSKRVRRPSEWQLNPFGDYDDPTSRRMGNPYLTPEYTHSGEVSYSRLGERYTITFSPYLRYTVDEISWRERITDDGVTILTFENFDTEQSYGAELVGSLTLGDWLKSNASVNAYKRVTEAGDLASELSSDAIGVRTRLSATAEIQPGLKLQLSQYYRSPMDIPGGRIDARTRTDLALQQEVLDGRGRLSLRVRDLFDGSQELIQRDLERYYQEYFRERDSRYVQLSFRYTFKQRGGDSGNRNGDRGRGWRGRR